MERLSAHGPEIRTALMAADRAVQLCRSLRSNPALTAVAIEESSKSQHPERRYFVSFQPVDPEQRAEMLANQQGRRSDRAQQEGAGYLWAADPDEPYWHVLTLSGSVYEVSAGGEACSCPDFVGRCQSHGLACKHLLAYKSGLGTFYGPQSWGTVNAPDGEPAPAATPTPGEDAAARRARVQRDKELLWG